MVLPSLVLAASPFPSAPVVVAPLVPVVAPPAAFFPVAEAAGAEEAATAVPLAPPALPVTEAEAVAAAPFPEAEAVAAAPLPEAEAVADAATDLVAEAAAVDDAPAAAPCAKGALAGGFPSSVTKN